MQAIVGVSSVQNYDVQPSSCSFPIPGSGMDLIKSSKALANTIRSINNGEPETADKDDFARCRIGNPLTFNRSRIAAV